MCERGFSAGEDCIGTLAEAFEHEGFIGGDEWLEAKQERRAKRESLKVEQAQGKQALRLRRRDLLILKGGGQVEEDVRVLRRGCVFQQMHNLIGSEGAAQADAVRCFQQIEAALADLACCAIGGEAVPAIQHDDRSVQAEFREQGGEKCRSAESSGDSAGLKGGEDVHAETIHGESEIKNPLMGVLWGNTMGEANVGERAVWSVNTGSLLPGAEVPVFEG